MIYSYIPVDPVSRLPTPLYAWLFRRLEGEEHSGGDAVFGRAFEQAAANETLLEVTEHSQ
jgi:hypothetical protein